MTVTAESRTELDRIRFYIDGKWVDPKGTDTQTSLEAATGELLGTASLGNEADIDAAGPAPRAGAGRRPLGPDPRRGAGRGHAPLRRCPAGPIGQHGHAGQPRERHADHAVDAVQRDRAGPAAQPLRRT